MFARLNIKKVVLTLVLIMLFSFTLAAVLGSLSTGRWYFAGNLTETVDVESAVDLAGVTEITVKTESTAVNLTPREGYEISAHLHGKASQGAVPDLVVDQKNGRVSINVEPKPRILVATPNILQLDISLPAGYSETLVIETVSGDTGVGGLNPGSFTFKSVSGNLLAELITVSDRVFNLSASTISGKIELKLPADAGFYLNAETTSGKIDSEFPITLNKIGICFCLEQV